MDGIKWQVLGSFPATGQPQENDQGGCAIADLIGAYASDDRFLMAATMVAETGPSAIATTGVCLARGCTSRPKIGGSLPIQIIALRTGFINSDANPGDSGISIICPTPPIR